MIFATEKLGKHSIEIEVDRKGKFSAQFDDQDYAAETHAELVELLKKAVKRHDRYKPIEVTVLGVMFKPARRSFDNEKIMAGDGTIDAVLRGYHARNRVWLLTSVEGSEKFQLGGYNCKGVIVRRLTLEETLRYLKLAEDRRIAATAIEDFVGSVKVDPKELVEAAQKEAK